MTLHEVILQVLKQKDGTTSSQENLFSFLRLLLTCPTQIVATPFYVCTIEFFLNLENDSKSLIGSSKFDRSNSFLIRPQCRLSMG